MSHGICSYKAIRFAYVTGAVTSGNMSWDLLFMRYTYATVRYSKFYLFAMLQLICLYFSSALSAHLLSGVLHLKTNTHTRAHIYASRETPV